MPLARFLYKGQIAVSPIHISQITRGPNTTCLMVTRNRVEQAIVSIGFYLRQTYKNRSMVIICESCPDDASRLYDYVRSLDRTDIKWFEVKTGSMSLGALRNAAIQQAQGEVLCQWDDDDFYHPQRLSLQLETLLARDTKACFLGDHLQYVPSSESLFWCDWYASSSDHSQSLPAAPQTVVWWRAADLKYPESGPCSQRSEDAELMRTLLRTDAVTVLGDCGYSYVYVSHGSNTWSVDHHLRIVSRKGLDARTLLSRRGVIEKALALYPVRYPLAVRDRSGDLAFSVSS